MTYMKLLQLINKKLPKSRIVLILGAFHYIIRKSRYTLQDLPTIKGGVQSEAFRTV